MASHRVSLILALALLLAVCAAAGAATLEGEQSTGTVPPGGTLILTYTLTVPEDGQTIRNVRLQMPVSTSETVNEASGHGPAMVTHRCYGWWVDDATGEAREASYSSVVRYTHVLLTPTVTEEAVTLTVPANLEAGESVSLSVTVERAPEP